MTHRYLSELDRIAACIGLVLSSLLIVWFTIIISREIYVIVGFLLFFACAMYLIFRRSLSSSTLSVITSAEASNRVYLFSNFLFLVFFGFSILFFVLGSEGYTRPVTFFASLSLIAALLAVEILFLPHGKLSEYLALVKIVLLVVYIEFSEVFIFPSIVGQDPWWHQMFTLNILKTGVILGGEAYSQLPFMHLLIGSFSLTTGLDYKVSAFVSVSFIQALCSVVFVFLIGVRLFDRKVGLLGALILGVANYELQMGYFAIPNTMATVFALVVVYFLLNNKLGSSVRATFLTILFMGAIVLTHAITSVFMLLLLVVFFAGFSIYNKYAAYKREAIPVTVPILFSVAMFSWWAFASGHLGLLAALIRNGFSSQFFSGLLPRQIAQYSSRVPFPEQLFNSMGLYLFFTISIVGCLYAFSRFCFHTHAFVIAATGTLTLVMAFFAPLAGLGILSGRWFYFSQILLSLPVAVGLLVLCWKIPSRLAKSLFLACLTFLLTFTMVASPIANFDNPTFSPNTQIRFAFTRSELQAVETLTSLGTKKMIVDSHYSYLAYSNYPVEDIGDPIIDGNYSKYIEEPILIREEIVSHPLEYAGSTYKLDYDPQQRLMIQGFSRIYDSGSVSGFIRPPS